MWQNQLIQKPDYTKLLWDFIANNMYNYYIPTIQWYCLYPLAARENVGSKATHVYVPSSMDILPQRQYPNTVKWLTGFELIISMA